MTTFVIPERTPKIPGLTSDKIIKYDTYKAALLASVSSEFDKVDILINGIGSVHPDLTVHLNGKIGHSIPNLISACVKLLTTYHSDMEYYMKELDETYHLLLKHLETAFNNHNKTFKVTLHGDQPTYNHRSVETWLETNPAKADAINIFMTNMKEKRWEPKIEGISETHLDMDGDPLGGHDLTIICDLY